MRDPEQATFVKMADLRVRYGGVSHMWVERRLKSDATFPRPALLVGKRRFWRLNDLEAWERSAAARGVTAA